MYISDLLACLVVLCLAPGEVVCCCPARASQMQIDGKTSTKAHSHFVATHFLISPTLHQ